MTTGKIANIIKGYMGRETDIDELRGPYAVKGIFIDDENPIERLEVGKVISNKYAPLMQMKLSQTPEFESRNDSYIEEDDVFSGTGYQLTDHEFLHVESLL